MALVGPCAIPEGPLDDAALAAAVDEVRARPEVAGVVVARSGDGERPLREVAAALPAVEGRCVVLVREVPGGWDAVGSGWPADPAVAVAAPTLTPVRLHRPASEGVRALDVGLATLGGALVGAAAGAGAGLAAPCDSVQLCLMPYLTTPLGFVVGAPVGAALGASATGKRSGRVVAWTLAALPVGVGLATGAVLVSGAGAPAVGVPLAVGSALAMPVAAALASRHAPSRQRSVTLLAEPNRLVLAGAF